MVDETEFEIMNYEDEEEAREQLEESFKDVFGEGLFENND